MTKNTPHPATGMTPSNAIFAPLAMLKSIDETTGQAIATLIDHFADEMGPAAIPSLERALSRFNDDYSPPTIAGMTLIQDAIDRL